MRTILGIDPGLSSTGYGVIGLWGTEARHIMHGVIQTSSDMAMGLRLLAIAREMREVIVEHCPDEAAVESIFFRKNAASAIPVAQARGVVLLTLAERDILPHEYSPLQVKHGVAGMGRAEKRQVQEMVRFILRLPQRPTPSHAADALAVALCHANSTAFREGLRDQ